MHFSHSVMALSYTTFAIGDAQPCKTEIRNNETVELTIPVSNTGKRDGTEILQVYVKKVNDTDGPSKTLRGFKRVDVKAGKTTPVTIELAPSSFEFYDRSQHKMGRNPWRIRGAFTEPVRT